jgi:hypothetical protein
VRAALDWLKRHRTAVAVVIGVVVVLRLVRNVAIFGWSLRELIPWDDVGPWLRDHWALAAAGAAIVFAAAFVIARAVLGRLGSRQTVRGQSREAAPPTDASGLTAGDPLREKG